MADDHDRHGGKSAGSTETPKWRKQGFLSELDQSHLEQHRASDQTLVFSLDASAWRLAEQHAADSGFRFEGFLQVTLFVHVYGQLPYEHMRSTGDGLFYKSRSAVAAPQTTEPNGERAIQLKVPAILAADLEAVRKLAGAEQTLGAFTRSVIEGALLGHCRMPPGPDRSRAEFVQQLDPALFRRNDPSVKFRVSDGLEAEMQELARRMGLVGATSQRGNPSAKSLQDAERDLTREILFRYLYGAQTLARMRAAGAMLFASDRVASKQSVSSPGSTQPSLKAFGKNRQDHRYEVPARLYDDLKQLVEQATWLGTTGSEVIRSILFLRLFGHKAVLPALIRPDQAAVTLLSAGSDPSHALETASVPPTESHS